MKANCMTKCVQRWVLSTVSHTWRESSVVCLPSNFQGGGKGWKEGDTKTSLTEWGGGRLGGLHLARAGTAGGGCGTVRAGAGGAHADTVGVVGREQWGGHAVLQQGRLDQHGVPPVVGNFQHSLWFISEKERGNAHAEGRQILIFSHSPPVPPTSRLNNSQSCIQRIQQKQLRIPRDSLS